MFQRCYMGRQKTKMCLVCGKDFLGNRAAFTCGTACRTYMSRDLKNGKKPEYWLLAKSKGQKIPDWNKPKQAKQKEKVVTETKVEETKQVLPELPKAKVEITLTKEQIVAKISELNRTLAEVKKEKSPLIGHPKTWILKQEVKISDLEEQILELQSQIKA